MEHTDNYKNSGCCGDVAPVKPKCYVADRPRSPVNRPLCCPPVETENRREVCPPKRTRVCPPDTCCDFDPCCPCPQFIHPSRCFAPPPKCVRLPRECPIPCERPKPCCPPRKKCIPCNPVADSCLPDHHDDDGSVHDDNGDLQKLLHQLQQEVAGQVEPVDDEKEKDIPDIISKRDE